MDNAIQSFNQIGWEPGQKILFFGIGNLGRQDDGLGILLTQKLESLQLPRGFATEANYQLNAEDALTISQYDQVVFMDASVKKNAGAPFALEEIKPVTEISFSTHAMSAGSVLAFCQQIYKKVPKAYVLSLPGYEWEVNQVLTPEAEKNLEQTLQCLMTWLESKKAAYA